MEMNNALVFQGISGAIIVPVSDIVLAKTVFSTSSSLYLFLNCFPGKIIPTVCSHVKTVNMILISPVLNISSFFVFILLYYISYVANRLFIILLRQFF